MLLMRCHVMAATMCKRWARASDWLRIKHGEGIAHEIGQWAASPRSMIGGPFNHDRNEMANRPNLSD